MTKNSADKETRLKEFSQCELEPATLSLIFEKQITGTLLCLEQSLNLFVDVVKTDRPGSLSLKELKLYISRNIEGLDLAVIDILEAVFEMNSLVLGDDRNYIKKANIRTLAELFIDINKSLVDNKVYAYYSDDSVISYKEHTRRKAHVFESLRFVAEKINSVLIVNNNEISFDSLLVKFQRIEVSRTTTRVLKSLRELLYIKKMFLGGELKTLTFKELKRLAGMMPDIAKISFDFSNFNKIRSSENEKEEIIETYAVGARALVKNLFYSSDSNEEIFTLSDIFNSLKIFGEDEITPWLKYGREYLLLKEVLLGSSDESFSAADVHTIFNDIIYTNLERGVFIYKNYRLNKEVLDSGDIIKENLPNIIDLGGTDYRNAEMMNRIVQDYFFFKGDRVSAEFSRDIRRSALSIFEISIYEDVMQRVFRGKALQLSAQLPLEIKDLELDIGDVSKLSIDDERKKDLIKELESELRGKKDHLALITPSQLRGDVIIQESLVRLFDDYSRILVDQEILTLRRSAGTAETITLVTSLFQNQSDGDADIEVVEMVEFAIELLSGMDMAKVGDQFFADVCGADRYSSQCFRDNFLNFLDLDHQGSKIKDSLPGLAKYLESKDVDVDAYLSVTEGFTRSCRFFDDGEPVPYVEGELSFVLTGMLAVEQTMIRFDLNNNNILDEDEVDKAFVVYESAIKALIPVGFLRGSAKDFFLYLVKFKRLPDVESVRGVRSFWRALKDGVKLGSYILFRSGASKRAKADRETLATILKTLGSLSPEAQNSPFPCHILK